MWMLFYPVFSINVLCFWLCQTLLKKKRQIQVASRSGKEKHRIEYTACCKRCFPVKSKNKKQTTNNKHQQTKFYQAKIYYHQQTPNNSFKKRFLEQIVPARPKVRSLRSPLRSTQRKLNGRGPSAMPSPSTRRVLGRRMP